MPLARQLIPLPWIKFIVCFLTLAPPRHSFINVLCHAPTHLSSQMMISGLFNCRIHCLLQPCCFTQNFISRNQLQYGCYQSPQHYHKQYNAWPCPLVAQLINSTLTYTYPQQDNVIPDTHSCPDCLEESVLLKDKQVFVLKGSISKGMDFSDNPLLIECFLHLPPLEVQDTNPTDYQWIFTKQNKTDKLVKQHHQFLGRYFNKILDDKEIICYSTQWQLQ